MRGNFRLSLFFAISLVISTSYVKPAHAICDGCVVAAIQSYIVGPGGVYPGPFKSMVPGETEGADEEPMMVTPPTSLVDYFEKVWWPRMVELTKAQQGANDKTQTLLSSMQARTAEAEQIAQYQQDTKKMNLEVQRDALGRTEMLCPEPSMIQSKLAMEKLALDAQRLLASRSAREMAGDKSLGGPYGDGRLEYDKARVQDRIRNQLCTQKGANGASESYCANTNAQLENADLLATTMFGSYVYDDSDDSQTPHNVNMVKRYVDNVFPSRIMEPLPVAVTSQSPLPNEAVRILADQASLTALTTTLQRPFLQEQAERGPVNGPIKALKALEAAMDRAGYKGEAREMLVNAKGNTSLAAADHILYKVYESDPKTYSVDLAKVGTMSEQNLLVVSIQKQMKQMTLLYDIREELKETNVLLGAIGSLLIDQRYQSIRERIQGLSGSGQRTQ